MATASRCLGSRTAGLPAANDRPENRHLPSARLQAFLFHGPWWPSAVSWRRLNNHHRVCIADGPHSTTRLDLILLSDGLQRWGWMPMPVDTGSFTESSK